MAAFLGYECNLSLFQELFQKLIKPTPDWGPALPKFRRGRYAAEWNQPEGIWNSGVTPKLSNLEHVDAPSTVTLESYKKSTPM